MMSDRVRDILTGLVTTVLFFGVVTASIQISNGALRAEYDVAGSFSAAGQGLLPGSDVKVRGVNIGEVKSIGLRDGRARIVLSIRKGRKIPVDATATIRPKTLFGEKFVDIDVGARESAGPFLSDGDELENTVGGFELQKVLDEAFPVIAAIDPGELAVVLSTLAEGGRGLGENVNRQLENLARVLDVNARHDADTDQFLRDFADLSDTLADAADDIVAGARDLNEVLPDLNSRRDQLAVLLEQTARLSADLADVLEANRPFLEKNVVLGGRTLETLADNRDHIQPLVGGLRMFFQTLAQAIRIPLEDGTRLAAVKFIAGGGNPTGQEGPFAGSDAPGPHANDDRSGLPDLGSDLRSGADAVSDLLGLVLQ